MASRCNVDNWSKAYSLQRFFRTAICQSDLTTVKGLIMHQRDGIDLNEWNADGLCPIHQCCIDGNKKLMSILLRAGANVDAADPKGWTALHTAAAVGDYELTKYLVRKGADVMAVTNDGELPIDLSLNIGIGILLGAAMKNQGYHEDASYYFDDLAACGGNKRLGSGSRLNLRDADPAPLQNSKKYSVKKDTLSRQRSLPNCSNFSIKERKSAPRLTLRRQISLPTYPIIEEDSLYFPTSILKKNNSFESRDSTSPTPSSTSTSSSSGYSDDSESDDKHRSVYRSNLSVQFDPESLFTNYIQENEYKKLSILLEDMSDLSIVDTLDRKGLTAVHWSAIKGFPECIAVLASFGANIDVKDPFGWTPLHAAVATNCISCVKKLLELNADIFAITSCGESVFDWTPEGELLDILREHIRSNIYSRGVKSTTV